MGKILAWESSFLCYEMLVFVLGDSGSAGMPCHCITPFSIMVCWFFPVVTNRFLGGQVERAAFLSLPELHISVKYKCVNSGKYRGINSCVTWRKMGINCAWRCWLKNKTSQSSSRSTINSLLALFFLFSFIFHWRIVFFSDLKSWALSFLEIQMVA